MDRQWDCGYTWLEEFSIRSDPTKRKRMRVMHGQQEGTVTDRDGERNCNLVTEERIQNELSSASEEETRKRNFSITTPRTFITKLYY